MDFIFSLSYLNHRLKKIFSKAINNPEFLLNKILFMGEITLYFFLITPFLYIDRLLPNSKRIFFAKFRSTRIGHLAPGFHIRYAQKKLKIRPNTCLYCFEDKISNYFLARQIKKYFFVNRTINYILILCRNLPFLDCLIDKEPFKFQRDLEGLTQKVRMPKFTYQENQYCINWLKSYGWKGFNQKIVCIHLRDSAYLKEYFKNTKYKATNWEYHSYRNSDIDKFTESINWLLSKDVFIIRTGKTAEKRLKIKSKNILDYPFCENQNDMLDIWFFANADLVISSASGIDEVSSAYKIPRIYINLLPIVDSPSWSKSLTISKHLYWKETNKHLTFEEYINLQRMNLTNDFKKNGIVIKSLSNYEIKSITIDGWNYFIEKKSIKEKDIMQTNKFKKLILSEDHLKKLHKNINNKWIVSSNLFKEK